jgi:hypothetical protein
MVTYVVPTSQSSMSDVGADVLLERATMWARYLVVGHSITRAYNPGWPSQGDRSVLHPTRIILSGSGNGGKSCSTPTMGAAMGRANDYLTVAQFDLLRWVAGGCKDGVYEGSSHRVSARALHNRGFLSVSGSGATWAARITTEGTRRLQVEAERIEVERERAHREEQARAARERERQHLRDRAVELLREVIGVSSKAAPIKLSRKSMPSTCVSGCHTAK